MSSSGHLVFFQSLFGLKEPQLFFDVLLHVGTLLAVVVYLRSDLWKMVRGSADAIKTGEFNPSAKLLLWVLIATIPTGLMGVFLTHWFESLFSMPKLVGIMLLITGIILFLTRTIRREGRGVKEMTWVDSILIGIGQGIAIIPGISRSGTTISSGLFRGLDRELSGKFSFFLSIPAILGAAVLHLREGGMEGELKLSLVGMAVAFIVGFLSLTFLMQVIKRGKLSLFSYYCWAMGITIILLAE